MIRHTRIGYGSSNSCPNNTLGGSRRRFVNSVRLYGFLPVQPLITASYRVVVISVKTHSYSLHPRRPSLVNNCAHRGMHILIVRPRRARRMVWLLPSLSPPKPLDEKNNEGDGYALTAGVQRGPSEAARCASIRALPSPSSLLRIFLTLTSRTFFSAAALSRLWLPSGRECQYRRKTVRR
jgi:hypothetical protein